MFSSRYAVPLAIGFAGVLIALSVVLSSGGSTDEEGATFGNRNSPSAENMRPVDIAVDHVRGNPNAPVTIVEYSDFQCPFCAIAHPTILSIVRERSESVRWVYRHLPLQNSHPQAVPAAHATECIAELAGNDAFWRATDSLFENQRALSDSFYSELAAEEGILPEVFAACQESRRHLPRVERDLKDAISSGGGGTPFVIVVNRKGEKFPFSGALPKAQIDPIIDQALAE